MMELKPTRSLLTDDEIEIDFSKGTTWLVAVNSESCDEIFKIITLINDQDFECEVYGILFEEDIDVKAWIKTQGIKINCFISEDPAAKSKLGVKSIPWFVCIRENNIIYTSSVVPSDLKAIISAEDLPEMMSPGRAPEKRSESPFKKSATDPLNPSALKLSAELPSTSMLINKPEEQPLEKALKKIDKLKLKVKQQEQTIEDYKVELRQLRGLLAAKPIEEKHAESPIKQMKNNFKPENAPKNKFTLRANPRFDENEFWRIDDNDEFQGSIKFEDIAASKDLWLMGLFKAQDSPKTVPKMAAKVTKILPPLQVERQKVARSMRRDNSVKKNEKRNASNIPVGYSSRKLIKN